MQLSKSRNFLKFLIVLFLIVTINSITAQSTFVKKISHYDGLPTEIIYDLYISKKSGLLYLGTDKGLISYDGVFFKIIPAIDNLANSITSIQEDNDGNIWCRNFANQIFTLQSGVLKQNLLVEKTLKNEKSDLVDFKLSNHHLWFITQNKIFYLENSKKVQEIFEISKEEILNEITAIDYNSFTNQMFISTRYGLHTFKKNRHIKYTPTVEGKKNLLVYKDQLTYYYKTKIGETWIGNYKINLIEELENTYLNKLSTINNELWLCTNNGIFKFNERENTFSDGLLKDKRVTNIVKDFEDNYWVSTIDEGLYIIPNFKIKTLDLDLEFTKYSDHNFTVVSDIYNGSRFYGTNKGIIIEVNSDHKIKMIYDTKSNNAIDFIKVDDGKLITSYGYFKLGVNEIERIPFYFVKDIKIDNSQNLVVATNTQALIISLNNTKEVNLNSNFTSKYEHSYFNDIDKSSITLRKKRSRCVEFDFAKNLYYIGYIDGLYTYDIDGNSHKLLLKNGQPIIASDMAFDKDRNLWIATIQNGLVIIYRDGSIVEFHDNHSLTSKNCKKILSGSDGIWLITDNGLNFIDFKTLKVRNIGLQICLKGIAINDFKIDKEHIILVSNKEIFYLDKNVLSYNTKFRFDITSFKVNGQSVRFKNNLQLNSEQNNIGINFRTIHFKSLGDYQYRYRLINTENVDSNTDWINLQSSINYVNYLSLTPGQYRFEIQINFDQNFSKVFALQFSINKPFYLTLWFYIFMLMLIISLFYFVYRWAEIKTRKSQEIKEQLALSQLTALRSQMNPHFMFNVLNAVQGLIYSNQKTKATDYLGKFSDLMRKILDVSDKKEVTIANEFETIDLYISLEKARFEDDFEYYLDLPEDIDFNHYIIPSMIIQPFVENAIKHGLMHKEGKKILFIKIAKLDDLWCITIDDNGIGRLASEEINQKIKKHISFATKAIENRVKLINKITNLTIDIETIDKKNSFNESLGTKIKIYIPIIEI